MAKRYYENSIKPNQQVRDIGKDLQESMRKAYEAEREITVLLGGAAIVATLQAIDDHVNKFLAKQGLPIIKTIDVRVYEFGIPNTSYIIKFSVRVDFPHDDEPWAVHIGIIGEH